MLILKIENFDQLADGGPVSFPADRRGFDIGREQHLDWTLPDPTRRISGKHCEIRYRDGGYWLHDISTNGTFVNKSDRRVQSPYLLANGDQLQIGDYVISVTIVGEAPAEAGGPRGFAPQVPAPVHTGDLWSSPAEAPPPISRRDLMPEQQRSTRSADFLESIADIPPPPVHEAWREPPPPPSPPPLAKPQPGPDLWAATGISRNDQPISRQPADWPAAPPAELPKPMGYSMASVAREIPFAAAPVPIQRPQPATPRAAPEPERPAEFERAAPPPPPPPPPPPLQQSPPPAPPPPPVPSGPSPEALKAQIEADLLRQFAAGAGIPETVLAHRQAGELAQELGGLMRLIAAQLMRLLKARAETKGMVRSAERTMIQTRDNNALKFTPTPEMALAVIFGPTASGYLDSKQTFEKSFADVMAHEEAVFAAMQQAVGELMADLSPDAIEGAAANVKISFLGNAKARNWDTYLERWNDKSGGGDNGILDTFLQLFAAHYDKMSSKRR